MLDLRNRSAEPFMNSLSITGIQIRHRYFRYAQTDSRQHLGTRRPHLPTEPGGREPRRLPR
jgi:hypothetical protein